VYALQATFPRNLVLSGEKHLDSIDPTGPALKKRGEPGGLACRDWGEARGGPGGRRPAGGRAAEGNHYFLISLYTYMFIYVYLYMFIFVYVYISNYYLPALSIEQTPSDLFNPFGAALRTIFRHP
jgi:hypothetical protein